MEDGIFSTPNYSAYIPVDTSSDSIDAGGGWNPAAGYNSSTAADDIDVGGGWNPATGTGDAATAAAAAATGVTDTSKYDTGTWNPSSGSITSLTDLFKALTKDANGNWDYTKLIPLIGGIVAANKSNTRTQPSGYQGGIPTYTAARQAPGAGQQISGNVLFSTPAGAVINPGSAGIATAAPANPRLEALLRSAGYNASGLSGTPKAAGGGLKSGGFVIPADVVSHFGNGSSDAGLKVLAARIGAEPIRGRGDGMSDSIPTNVDGQEKARVAHEEAYMSPEKVARLGGGDARKGAQKLRDMMASIRQARTGSTQQGRQVDPNRFMPGGEIKGYAAGDNITSSAVNAGVTGTESNLSNWAGPYVTDMLAKGKALSEMPYEQYQGPLTAGASDLQTKAFTGLQGVNFPGNLGQSFSSSTAPTIGADGSPTGPTGVAANYMNPYLDAVLNPQLEELRRQAKINNMQGLGQFVKSGAFGGGRQAIMESENARNLLQEQNKTIGQGYANAYDKAMGQFNTEQNQAKTLVDLMASQGQTQRDIAQQGIAAEKNAFEEARANPYKMVQFQKSLLEGLPTTAQTYNLSDTNNLTQFTSGLTALKQAMDALGIK
jgi:hypothetical protein